MKIRGEGTATMVFFSVCVICATFLLVQFMSCARESMKQESIERMAKEKKP